MNSPRPKGMEPKITEAPALPPAPPPFPDALVLGTALAEMPGVVLYPGNTLRQAAGLGEAHSVFWGAFRSAFRSESACATMLPTATEV